MTRLAISLIGALLTVLVLPLEANDAVSLPLACGIHAADPECGQFNQGTHPTGSMGPFYGSSPGCGDTSKATALANAVIQALQALDDWLEQNPPPAFYCPIDEDCPRTDNEGCDPTARFDLIGGFHHDIACISTPLGPLSVATVFVVGNAAFLLGCSDCVQIQ